MGDTICSTLQYNTHSTIQYSTHSTLYNTGSTVLYYRYPGTDIPTAADDEARQVSLRDHLSDWTGAARTGDAVGGRGDQLEDNDQLDDYHNDQLKDYHNDQQEGNDQLDGYHNDQLKDYHNDQLKDYHNDQQEGNDQLDDNEHDNDQLDDDDIFAGEVQRGRDGSGVGSQDRDLQSQTAGKCFLSSLLGLLGSQQSRQGEGPDLIYSQSPHLNHFPN